MHGVVKVDLVPKAGLEPARLAAGDFESPASTIPPLGPIGCCGLRPSEHAAFCARTGFTTTLSQFRAKGLW